MEVGRNAVPGAISRYNKNVHTGREILCGIEIVARV